ncbi:reverse transcriptase domain-containing protein [Tanacetum coccineum]
MHTRAFNSELVEPLSEPERTVNHRLRRRNNRVPFERRDERPTQPRIVYLPILDINYFHHFLNILENYNLIDDEPMWAADRVVAPTPDSAITIPEIANEFAIKGSSNSDTDKIVIRMDAMTMKMDAQYKEMQSRSNHSIHKYDEDDKFILADKQSGRPSGSLPSNTQPNPKGRSTKPYQPSQARNELVNVVFTEDEEEESTPQPKSQTPKPVKEAPIPKPYKPNIPYPQRLRKEKMESQYDFDAILDEGSEILHSIEGTILKEKLFAEFDELMGMNFKGNTDSESETEEPPFEKITFNTDYKIKTSLEEPHSDLELKPLPNHLEYVFLEEPSFLLVIISSQLSDKNKNKLISVLKRHTQAFTWKKNRHSWILRMPFVLCNAPATFQRCMLAIFHDMIKESVKVFMDDFSIFGDSFNKCLKNLDKLLQHCKDAHLVLNWEKCHFMVKEGIVLGHKVSSAGLEVDKAKIDVISKLPPPTNIKGVRIFLGHASFC